MCCRIDAHLKCCVSCFAQMWRLPRQYVHIVSCSAWWVLSLAETLRLLCHAKRSVFLSAWYGGSDRIDDIQVRNVELSRFSHTHTDRSFRNIGTRSHLVTCFPQFFVCSSRILIFHYTHNIIWHDYLNKYSLTIISYLLFVKIIYIKCILKIWLTYTNKCTFRII